VEHAGPSGRLTEQQLTGAPMHPNQATIRS
jgi:hypothetical protein